MLMVATPGDDNSSGVVRRRYSSSGMIMAENRDTAKSIPGDAMGVSAEAAVDAAGAGAGDAGANGGMLPTAPTLPAPRNGDCTAAATGVLAPAFPKRTVLNREPGSRPPDVGVTTPRGGTSLPPKPDPTDGAGDSKLTAEDDSTPAGLSTRVGTVVPVGR